MVLFLIYCAICTDSYVETPFSIVKQLDPVGLAFHTNDCNCKRGEYIVPGPNFIWSIDGHDNVNRVGFPDLWMH